MGATSALFAVGEEVEERVEAEVTTEVQEQVEEEVATEVEERVPEDAENGRESSV
jgi:hypothetical protein